MPDGAPEGRNGTACDGEDDGGCAFVVKSAGPQGGARFCAAPRRPNSSYCADHHTRCHLPSGSSAERQKLHEIDALARAAGGRQGRPAGRPPERLLRRIDRLAAALSRPSCSRIVLEKGGDGDAP